jgi:hypothetical protein
VRAVLPFIVILASACATADAAPAQRGHPLASSIPLTPAPRATPPVATPAYAAGHGAIGGSVAGLALPLLTLRTVEEGDVTVDLAGVRSVWRETWVSASALEVGDDLFVDGSRTPGGFVATNVYANIGRLDGTIISITDGVLELSAARPWAPGTVVHAVLSPYITHEGPWRLSDLHPGMTIGAVVYRDRVGPRRITRIW